MSLSPSSISVFETSEEEYTDSLKDQPSPEAAKALNDELRRQRIKNIEEALEHGPTGMICVSNFRKVPTYSEFELLALSVFPISNNADAHLTTHEVVNIKCCKKDFQLLFNCEANDAVIGLHEAGSLLRVLATELSTPKDHFTMSSAPPISQQHGVPQTAHDKSGNSGDPFVNAPYITSIGNTAHNLAADAYEWGNSPFQSNNTQDSPSISNPIAVYPSTNHFMAADPRLSYGNSFGAANGISPSKRVFSSSSLNSNAMVTSELDYSPSSKRRAGLTGSNIYNSTEKTCQEDIENAEPMRRAVANQRIRRATTSTVTQAPSFVNGTSDSAMSDVPQDYSKYYQYLAEKHNIKGYQMANGGGVAQSQVYVSPYKSTDTPTSNSQQQYAGVNPVANDIPQTFTPAAFPDGYSTRPGQSDHPNNLSQQGIGFSKLPTHNAIEEKMRRHTESIRDLQMAEIEIARQRRANSSTGLHQQLVGPPANAHSISDLCSPHQPMQGNTYPDSIQNTPTSQDLYAEHSNLELDQYMGVGHGKNSRILSPPIFSTDNLGFATAPHALLSQYFELSLNDDLCSEMAPGQWLGPNTDSEMIANGACSHYTMDHNQEHASSSTCPSTASYSTAKTTPQARPRTDINKIHPAFRQEYQAYEENLMNGIQTQTSLPPWLVMRARRKAGLLPPGLSNSDSGSEDDCARLPPKPPAYERIVATNETGPLPNINQPYTGSLNPSSPHLAAHLALKQMAMPRMPVQTPTRKTATPRKKTAASKTKKTPTRSKSQAKKPSQSDGRAGTSACHQCGTANLRLLFGHKRKPGQ
ncbi:hypothetical protein BKA64DRAFT_13334 [Cadophora sp. MPI-SDFR-AT-0126]|nr:hypothetical protein BKA64DRAFT_13334 [Leotiomycetes sp. MPI-SDFR-AT-0126]